MADKFEDIDFTDKPNFMSMEQYAGVKRRERGQDVFGNTRPMAQIPEEPLPTPTILPAQTTDTIPRRGDLMTIPDPKTQPVVPTPSTSPDLTMPRRDEVMNPLLQATGASPADQPAADAFNLEQRAIRDKNLQTIGEAAALNEQMAKDARGAGGFAARNSARETIKSLQEQGMGRDDIEGAVEGITGSKLANLSPIAQSRALAKVARKKAFQRSKDRREQRTSEKLMNDAKFSTDEEGNRIAGNKAARLVEMNDLMETPAAHPENEKMLQDYMTPSQKRQAQRAFQNRDATQMKALQGNLEKARVKMEKDDRTIEFKKNQKLIEQRLKAADVAEERTFYNNISDRMKAINDEAEYLEKKLKSSDLKKSKEYEALVAKRTQLTEEMMRGYIAGAEDTAAVAQPDGVTPAPQAAIDALAKTPALAPQFQEKYGYLPKGF